MTDLVQALSRFSTTSVPEIETLKILAIFSGTGLLVSFLLASGGFDLRPELF